MGPSSMLHEIHGFQSGAGGDQHITLPGVWCGDVNRSRTSSGTTNDTGLSLPGTGGGAARIPYPSNRVLILAIVAGSMLTLIGGN